MSRIYGIQATIFSCELSIKHIVIERVLDVYILHIQIRLAVSRYLLLDSDQSWLNTLLDIMSLKWNIMLLAGNLLLFQCSQHFCTNGVFILDYFPFIICWVLFNVSTSNQCLKLMFVNIVIFWFIMSWWWNFIKAILYRIFAIKLVEVLFSGDVFEHGLVTFLV